jgi:hypothetical protein
MGSFAGQRSRPTDGVKGSKGGAGSQPRMRLKKMPAPPEDPAELQKQSSIYLKLRNRQMRAKSQLTEMELAHARDQLIDKELAIKQSVYLVIELRQKLLGLPEKLRTKFGPERFNHEMVHATRVMVTEILNAISQLPDAIQPGWLEKLDKEDV